MTRCAVVHALAERDGWTCAYCGLAVCCAHSAPEPIPGPFGPGVFVPALAVEIDHRVPRARGGTNDLDNLVLACGPCNRAKADLPLTAALLDMLRCAA